MKKSGAILNGVFSCTGMLLLILDAKTGLQGAKEGIDLCIHTVIPSLFPFFVLAGVLRNAMSGSKLRILKPLGAMCQIPDNSLYLLLIGLIGGYPVGAQYINQAYTSGQIDRATAKRMLGFCNNAGPAFIFGMCARMFGNPLAGWALWLIHILSALAAGILLPGKDTGVENKSPAVMFKKNPSVLESSIKSMGLVCGWVILFRVMIAFLRRWILWLLPKELQILFIGLLELTNGCAELPAIENTALRFPVCVFLLNFGGVCVGMQTLAVSDRLKGGWHFPGKVIQAFTGLLLCVFGGMYSYNFPVFLLVSLSVILCGVLVSVKKAGFLVKRDV